MRQPKPIQQQKRKQPQIPVSDPSQIFKNKKIRQSNFSLVNHFKILQNNIKENDHDLNENDPIDNNISDSSKDKEKTMSNRNAKVKAPMTVIVEDSILKIYILTEHFKDRKT